ncbi:docking protein 2-like [Haliotis rubra]|uniref:docking protein 2-like n=1 Tax=Haliotis rubra TaxID=36100 RepID=UPI001EE5A9AC|nr:docking protein 2-like [Haliotis rubra]
MEDHPTFFRVNISGDEITSKRCHLKGVYCIAVRDTSLCLCDVRSNRVIYEWPYVCIRKYGKSSTQFTLEAGRKSSTGAGVFNMETADGSLILKRVTEKIEKIKAAKGCKQSPARNKSDPQRRSNSSEEDVHLYANEDTIMNRNDVVYDKVEY